MVIGDLGHVKVFDSNSSNSNSTSSNQVFGTSNYLAPEAYDRRKRSNKIDIWSFGCIVYELFNLEKLFNNRQPDRLREIIRAFNVENDLNPGKMRPVHVRVVKKYFFVTFFYFGKTHLMLSKKDRIL